MASNMVVQEEAIDVDQNDESDNQDNPFESNKRKKTSEAWDGFAPPDNNDKVECKGCKKKLKHKPGGPTTTLLRHLKERCPKRRLATNKQQTLAMEKTTLKEGVVINYKYDHVKVREAAARMILAHGYTFMMMEHEFFNQFMMTVTPYYQKISRIMAKNDVMALYELEKKKLKSILQSVGKVSITSDFWKSTSQHIGYMCVTGHFVDCNWKLNKRVLSFCDVPPPHTGLVISDAMFKCLNDWGIEKKVSTVTFDNATNNDAAIRQLKRNFQLNRRLPFAEKIFHVRCCAHIVNLMVQDGLTEIKDIIENVRESVKFINASEARLIKFGEIVKQLQLPHRKLVLDVITRWNSTFAMLFAALQFKDVFPRYQERDPTYQWLPSEDDWKRAEEVCSFLEVFQDVTDTISGNLYPTSNLFLPEVWKMKEVLDAKCKDGSTFMQAMATKMKAKFDKYWGECNLLMAIAAVLDPTCKMKLIEFCFPKIYPEIEVVKNLKLVRNALEEMYNEYALEYMSLVSHDQGNDKGVISDEMGPVGTSKLKRKGRTEFDNFIRKSENLQPSRSDLDVYLEEGVYLSDDEDFDVIGWWSSNNSKYRILSKMAVDVLSIPITTVASESAFSTGGRVIDPYRANLDTKTVEALICGGDWIKANYGVREVYTRTTPEVKEIILPME